MIWIWSTWMLLGMVIVLSLAVVSVFRDKLRLQQVLYARLTVSELDELNDFIPDPTASPVTVLLERQPHYDARQALR